MLYGRLICAIARKSHAFGFLVCLMAAPKFRRVTVNFPYRGNGNLT